MPPLPHQTNTPRYHHSRGKEGEGESYGAVKWCWLRWWIDPGLPLLRCYTTATKARRLALLLLYILVFLFLLLLWSDLPQYTVLKTRPSSALVTGELRLLSPILLPPPFAVIHSTRLSLLIPTIESPITFTLLRFFTISAPSWLLFRSKPKQTPTFGGYWIRRSLIHSLLEQQADPAPNQQRQKGQLLYSLIHNKRIQFTSLHHVGRSS